MTTETLQAAKRLEQFISAREAHQYRYRITDKPLSKRIIAEYGNIDVDDLRILIKAVRP